MTSDRATILAELRAKLAPLAPPSTPPPALPSGVPELDARTGGWPHPGLAVIAGAPGLGRMGFVLPALRALTADGRAVAIVDAMGWCNPAGLPGVALERLILVRPGASQASWAAEQLLRCGEVPLVVVLDPPPPGRLGVRWMRAAEMGGTTGIVLLGRPDPGLPAKLRLEMRGPGTAQVIRATGNRLASHTTGDRVSL